jgi:hypothetical protein
MSLQKEHGVAVGLKDMGGQGIARARVYLAKVCSITAPFELPEWSEAGLFAEIRNAIAHTNGFIECRPDDKGSLFSRLARKGIAVRTEVAGQEDGQIVLDQPFVLNSVKTYRVLLAEITGLGRDFITPKHGVPSRIGRKAESGN